MSAEELQKEIERAAAATEVSTIEQQQAHVAAMERQKLGLEARLARVRAGKPDPADEKRLLELIAGVDARLAGEAPRRSRRKRK